MKLKLNKKTAGTGLLFLLSATLMLMMEIVAVAVLALFMGITILNTFHPSKYRNLAKVGMWIVFAYLLLNTAGNLSSEQIIEKTVLAPATFLMSLLSLRLAIFKKT